MLKLLLLLFAVWVVYVLVKRRRPSAPPETRVGNMVRCAVCGVHLPESEAISSGGRHYCSEAHFLRREQA